MYVRCTSTISKNTIRDGGSTALYTTYTVYIDYTVFTALHCLNSRPIVGGELCDYLGATMLHSPGSFPFWYGRVSQCINMKSHDFVPDDFGYGHMKHCDRK